MLKKAEGKMAECGWLTPVLVAQIEFMELTGENTAALGVRSLREIKRRRRAGDAEHAL